MRRGELAVNALVVMGPAFFGFLLICLLTTPLIIVAMPVCYTIGVAMLVKAKWPLYQRGVWTRLGPASLPRSRRRIYWIGYAFIAFGIAINVLVLEILTHQH